MCKVFQAWGMSYPVPLSFSPVGDHLQFPWVRPSNMLQTMASNGDFHLLLSGFRTMPQAREVLETFWGRYETLFPEHGLFRRIRESQGRLQAHQCLPVLVHGDEGTTYKKNGMLVIQFSGVVGHGTKKTFKDQSWKDDLKSAGIPLNLVNNALQSRFLTFLCPRDRVQKIVSHNVCMSIKECKAKYL